MPDFSTFAGIRAAREALYTELGGTAPSVTAYSIDRRGLLKDAEEALLVQAQAKTGGIEL